MNIQDIVLNQKRPISNFDNLVVGDTTVNLCEILAAASLVSTGVHFQVTDRPLKIKDFKDANKLSNSNTPFNMRRWSNQTFDSWFNYKPSAILECFVLFITPTKYIEIDVHLNEMEISFKTNVVIPLNALNHLGSELVKLKGIALLLDSIDKVQVAAKEDICIFTSSLPSKSVVSFTYCNNEDIDAFKVSAYKWVMVQKDSEYRLYHIETKAYFEIDFNTHSYGVKNVYLDGLQPEQIETLHKDLIGFLSTPRKPVIDEVCDKNINSDNQDRKALLNLIDGLRSQLGSLTDEDIEEGDSLESLYVHIAAIALEVDAIKDRQKYLRHFDASRDRRRNQKLTNFEVDDAVGEITDRFDPPRGRGERIGEVTDPKRRR